MINGLLMGSLKMGRFMVSWDWFGTEEEELTTTLTPPNVTPPGQDHTDKVSCMEKFSIMDKMHHSFIQKNGLMVK